MIGKEISHYKIIEKLGQGGMGIVYKAEDIKLKRTIALKFLPSELTRDVSSKNRFIHEAQAASALDHPNICTIHEIGESDDGEMFIAMACYDGISLKDRIAGIKGVETVGEPPKPLSIDESINIVIQIAEGLAAAHDKGVVHRDVKPDNIIVTINGIVKILDFGLAKLAGQSRLTISGTTLGTAAYMSPEQAQSRPLDHRSDIYSLSVILYEMVAGDHPFKAEHQLAMMYSIINEKPESVTALNPEIPEKLEQIILKGMEKNPDDRYDNLHDMIADLKNLRMETSVEQVSDISDKSKPGKSAFAEGIKNYIFKHKIVLPLLVLVIAPLIIYFIRLMMAENDQDKRLLAQTHVEKALSDLENGDLMLAKRELNMAVEIDPGYSQAWSHLAAVNIQLNDLDLAITQSKEAISLDDRNTNAYYNLAYAQEEKGDIEEALGNYGKTVTIDSLFIPGYSALGNLFIKNNQPEQAIAILEIPLKIAPDSKYLYLIHKNLGKAYYHLSQYEKAINHLNLSIKTQPQEVAETKYYLALCYEETGETNRATSVWQEYIAVEKDQKKKIEAQNRLQSLKN